MKLSEYQKIAERAEASRALCAVLGYDWRNDILEIDEFQDRYFDELKRRLSRPGSPFKGDPDVETVSDTAFTEVQWNRYKKIYDFDPTFIRYLASTEAGEVNRSVLERLPFRSFYISFGGTILDEGVRDGYVPCVGMFVYIYFTKTDGKDFVHFALSLRGNNDESVPLYCGIRDGAIFSEATDIDKMPENVRRFITHNYDPQQIELVKKRQENQKPFFMIAMNACQYLCASNAEIRDVKVSKKDRPVLSVSGKKKQIAVQLSQVGFRLGEKFEKMYRDLESDCAREGRRGVHRRPHVRRAHWHHYWTGPGRTVLEVRWLEPVFVMGSDETIDAVSHKVEGDLHDRAS